MKTMICNLCFFIMLCISVSGCSYIQSKPELVKIGLSSIDQVIEYYKKQNAIVLQKNEFTRNVVNPDENSKEIYTQYVFRKIENNICVETTCDFVNWILFRSEKQKIDLDKCLVK